MKLSLCAISHSWCGKMRSVPPPCRSMRGAELVHRHHRALDVPARAADAERRAPRGLVGERRLPEHEVERVAAVRVVGVAAARAGEPHHVVARVVRQLAEARERRHVEVDGAVREVRVPVVEQLVRPSRSCRRSTRSRAARRPAGACRAPPCRSGSARARPRRARGTGRRARAPSGRIESSTSVTLRTMRTSWPSSSSRRMRRSYVR